MTNQIILYCRTRSIGADFPDGDSGQDVSQGRTQRGFDCLRIPRAARHQGPWHGDLSHGGELPRADLELMSFDVAPQQDLYTKQGVAVTVEAVAQIKVRSDQASILTAAEQFLTKAPQQREGLIRLVMEGHLRGIIGQLTVEQIVKEPEMVGERMRSTCADDMSKMGLEVISFTIKEVRDKNEYISNMGRPDVARIKRDAEMATAEAERDTAIKRATAHARIGGGQGAGRSGAGDCRDRIADAPGRGAARSRHQEGRVCRAEPPPAGAGRQGLRVADQRDAAAGDG